MTVKEILTNNTASFDGWIKAYISPNIPDEKLRSAANFIAGGINKSEIIGILDSTLLESAKEGYVFTKDTFYCNNNLELCKVPYNSVKKISIDKDELTVFGENGKILFSINNTYNLTELGFLLYRIVAKDDENSKVQFSHYLFETLEKSNERLITQDVLFISDFKRLNETVEILGTLALGGSWLAAGAMWGGLFLGPLGAVAGGLLGGSLGFLLGNNKEAITLQKHRDFLIEKNKYPLSGYTEILKGNIQWIHYEKVKELFNRDHINILGDSSISSGTILVKHPFLQNTYMEIDKLEKELFHSKMLNMSHILKNLGAKSFSGYAKIVEYKTRHWEGDGQISYKIIEVDSSVKTTIKEQYESEYSISDTYQGVFTEDSYEKAKSIANQFGLDNDIDVKNLINMRNPKENNTLLSRKVNIELSRELNKILDTAFSLSVLPVFTSTVRYKEVMEIRKKVVLTFDINF